MQPPDGIIQRRVAKWFVGTPWTKPRLSPFTALMTHPERLCLQYLKCGKAKLPYLLTTLAD
jgi:hypothetical protein